MNIGATTVGIGKTGPQLLGWRTCNVLVPQLLGRSFQKAWHFTASSHQNAGFSIWVFINFPWVTPSEAQTLGHIAGGDDSLPHLNTQPGLWPGAGRFEPNLGPPQLFSRGCAPMWKNCFACKLVVSSSRYALVVIACIT